MDTLLFYGILLLSVIYIVILVGYTIYMYNRTKLISYVSIGISIVLVGFIASLGFLQISISTEIKTAIEFVFICILCTVGLILLIIWDKRQLLELSMSKDEEKLSNNDNELYVDFAMHWKNKGYIQHDVNTYNVGLRVIKQYEENNKLLAGSWRSVNIYRVKDILGPGQQEYLGYGWYCKGFENWVRENKN